MVLKFKNSLPTHISLAINICTNTHGVEMMIYRKGLKSLSVLLINISLVGMASAYTAGGSQASMTTQELTTLIKQIDTQNNLQIAATPEVLATINHIRSDEAVRASMHLALENIDQNKSFLQSQLKENNLPTEFLALPLLEPDNQQALAPATLRTLSSLHDKFQNWKLAIIAYNYG
jgi:hypothetical protein